MCDAWPITLPSYPLRPRSCSANNARHLGAPRQQRARGPRPATRKHDRGDPDSARPQGYTPRRQTSDQAKPGPTIGSGLEGVDNLLRLIAPLRVSVWECAALHGLRELCQ